jgi:FkbM family methyltransferase
MVGTLANDQLAVFLATRLCRPSGLFLDIGAHIGSIISEVAHRCPSAKIVAIEPIPEKVAHLRAKFPFAEIHECALGDSNGESRFYVNTRRSGFSSLGKPQAENGGIVEIKVLIRKLDNLIASHQIDVIKIDTEGAELGVLRGGDRLVTNNRPTILFESGPTRDDGLGYTKEALWTWCAQRDFDIIVPNRLPHNGPGLSLDGFLESHLYPRRTTNYFAVPKERRIEIRDRARVILKIRVSDQPHFLKGE